MVKQNYRFYQASKCLLNFLWIDTKTFIFFFKAMKVYIIINGIGFKALMGKCNIFLPFNARELDFCVMTVYQILLKKITFI